MIPHDWTQGICTKCGTSVEGAPCPTARFIIPFLPPTSNHIYVTNRKGQRFLSKEATAWKRQFSETVVAPNLATISQLPKDSVYEIYYRFFFGKDDVLTKSFGTQGGAASRYKRMDLENRLKLISDALATAIGIDDCQIFRGGQEKRHCAEVGNQPQVHIYVTQKPLSTFGF